MRIPSLLGAVVALSVTVSAHADLSLDDLPYIQGTPVAEAAWEIQDYSQNGDGIQWVWLQQGANSAYVVYPSEEAALLPDNSVIPGSSDQITLRFVGDAEQELLFTRFGSALFTLIGNEVQVRYTAVAANTPAGAYPGDLSMDATEIHMEGELMLDGSLALDAEQALGLLGNINVADELLIEASTGILLGSIKNNDATLDACAVYAGGTLTGIQVDTFLGAKGCFGDVVLSPESIEQNQGSEASTLQTSSLASGGSKGGSINWWLISLLAGLSFARKSYVNRCAS